MSRGSRNSRGTTIREGTGEKNWYVLAAYVAFSVVGLAVMSWGVYQFGALTGSIAISGILMTLLIFALATLPALFKDSAYLRGTAAGWNPKWWFYIGIPVVVPVILYIVGEAFGETFLGIGFALFSFPLVALVSNAYYLYQRHQYIGVP